MKNSPFTKEELTYITKIFWQRNVSICNTKSLKKQGGNFDCSLYHLLRAPEIFFFVIAVGSGIENKDLILE